MAKNSRETRFLHLRNGHTDGRTDGPTDGPTDRPSYRDAFLTDASKNHLCHTMKRSQEDISAKSGGATNVMPTRPQRYCDPASTVYSFFLPKWCKLKLSNCDCLCVSKIMTTIHRTPDPTTMKNDSSYNSIITTYLPIHQHSMVMLSWNCIFKQKRSFRSPNKHRRERK